MVQNIQYGSGFNFQNNFVDDVYIEVVPPQAYFNGSPTAVGWVEGTASWGPVGVPILFSDPAGYIQSYGGISSARLTDIHDLCFDLQNALNQASGNGLVLYGQRATDGSDVPASVILLDDQAVEETITIAGTVTTADHIAITLLNSNFGSVTVGYTTVMSDTVTIIATAITAAINTNTTLIAAGVTATSSSGVISVAWPNTEGGIAFSKTITGASTETVTFLNNGHNGINLTAIFTGILGNKIVVQLAPGTGTNTVTVTVVPFSGGGTAEVYANISTAGSGVNNFWNLLLSAINNGLGPTRPPSNYLVASGASNSALLPILDTFALSGGTDGRVVSSANLLGSATGGPGGTSSGIYSIENVEFAPSVSWIAGLTDTTIYSNILTFAQQNNLFFLFTFAAGVNTAAAVTAKLATGIADYHIAFMKDWCYVYDQANAQVALTPPLAIAGGSICCLGPWNSPFNKVVNILGTERSYGTNNQRYSNAEIAQLTKAGISLIAKPIPRGSQFGFRISYNSIGNKQTNATIEYSRTTNFFAQSVGDILGKYEGEGQTDLPTDELRSQISQEINQFFGTIQTAQNISSFNVICNLTNNTDGTIPTGILYIAILVQYKAAVYDIFAQLNGGVSVNTQTNSAGTQPLGT